MKLVHCRRGQPSVSEPEPIATASKETTYFPLRARSVEVVEMPDWEEQLARNYAPLRDVFSSLDRTEDVIARVREGLSHVVSKYDSRESLQRELSKIALFVMLRHEIYVRTGIDQGTGQCLVGPVALLRYPNPRELPGILEGLCSQKCWTAAKPRCNCRCGGRWHGRGRKELWAEMFRERSQLVESW